MLKGELFSKEVAGGIEHALGRGSRGHGEEEFMDELGRSAVVL